MEPIGNMPPAEAEERYYAALRSGPWQRDSNQTASGKAGAVHYAILALTEAALASQVNSLAGFSFRKSKPNRLFLRSFYNLWFT